MYVQAVDTRLSFSTHTGMRLLLPYESCDIHILRRHFLVVLRDVMDHSFTPGTATTMNSNQNKNL